MNSISQNAIQTNQKSIQSSKVEIDTSTARKIATDLIIGDVCKEEIKLVRANLDLTKKEVVLKDSIINTLGKQKDGLNLIISKKDEIYTKQEEISNTFKKELSKQRATNFLYKTLSLLGVISTSLLIIK